MRNRRLSEVSIAAAAAGVLNVRVQEGRDRLCGGQGTGQDFVITQRQHANARAGIKPGTDTVLRLLAILVGQSVLTQPHCPFTTQAVEHSTLRIKNFTQVALDHDQAIGFAWRK